MCNQAISLPGLLLRLITGHTVTILPELLPFTDKLYGVSNAGAIQRGECVYVKPHTVTLLGVHVC